VIDHTTITSGSLGSIPSKHVIKDEYEFVADHQHRATMYIASVDQGPGLSIKQFLSSISSSIIMHAKEFFSPTRLPSLSSLSDHVIQEHVEKDQTSL